MKARKVKAVDPENLAPIRNLVVDGVRYQFGHQIGVGAFTRVYKATDEWGNALAVKIYPPDIKSSVWQNEVRNLKRFCGPGVVYLHRVFQHEKHAYLVLDDGGISVSRCTFKTQELRIQAARLTARGLLQTLSRLHFEKHCHGDINPQNVLLRSDSAKKLSGVTVIDLALCKSEESLSTTVATMAHWTPPPEYFKKEPLRGAALDIWHAAVLLLQIVKGETLDYSKNDILSGKPLKDAQTLNLPITLALQDALASDPNQRPDAITLWRQIRSADNG